MEIVNVDNFVRAETSRMFDSVVAQVGLNTWSHAREPVPIDQQHVIRMNRDTLYSTALVDLRDDATITIPDMGERYGSVMVVNEDHHLNRILHAPGRHELTLEEFETSFAVLVARLFVDPADPGDIAAVNAIQDALDVEAGSSGPHPDYDPETLDATRALLNQLATGIPDSRGTFGPRGEVDPVRHLVGTAFGWGGLPESEARLLEQARADGLSPDALQVTSALVQELSPSYAYEIGPDALRRQTRAGERILPARIRAVGPDAIEVDAGELRLRLRRGPGGPTLVDAGRELPVRRATE